MNKAPLTLVIADDTPSSRRLLVRFLKFMPDVELVGEAENGERLIELVKEKKPNLALVDVNMPEMNGFEAIQSALMFHPKLKFVFITGYEEFAAEAFNISAADYIVKPVEQRRLQVAIEKVRRLIEIDNVLSIQSGERQLELECVDKLIVRFDRSIYFIPYKDIFFIEKVERKSVIHTKEKVYETYENLSVLEERLPSVFIQTHRSYLVNFQHISHIRHSGETYLIYFYGYDKPAYISRNKMSTVQKYIALK